MALKVPTSGGRRVTLATLAALLVVLLSGCLRYTESLTIDSDDTVSGIIVIATQPAQDEGTGAVPTPPPNSTLPIPQSQSDSIVVSSYANGAETGYQVTFNRASFEDVSAFAPLGDRGGALKVSRDGNTVTVTMSIDLTWAASTSDLAYFKDHATASVELTVPGEIGATDGDVSGQTITWQLTPLELNTLSATFDSTQAAPTSTSSESISALRAALIAGILLVLAAAAWLFLLRPMLSARREALADGPRRSDSDAATAPEPPSTRSGTRPASVTALWDDDPEPEHAADAPAFSQDSGAPSSGAVPVADGVVAPETDRVAGPEADPFGDSVGANGAGPGLDVARPLAAASMMPSTPDAEPMAVAQTATGDAARDSLADPFSRDADPFDADPIDADPFGDDPESVGPAGQRPSDQSLVVPPRIETPHGAPPAADDPFVPGNGWAPDPGPQPASPPPFTLSPPVATTPANETPPASGVFQIPDPFGDQTPANDAAAGTPLGAAPEVAEPGNLSSAGGPAANTSELADPFSSDELPKPVSGAPGGTGPVVGNEAIALPDGYPDAVPADLSFATAAASPPSTTPPMSQPQPTSTSIAGGGWPPPRPRWKDN